MLDEDDLIKAELCVSDKDLSDGSNQIKINSALFSFCNADEIKE